MNLARQRWLRASVVLPVLGLLSFGCAFQGWTLQHVRKEDALFLSLEALKLGSEYKKSDGWRGNQWLEAARLFGLAFYLLTLFKAFGLLLRTQIADLRAQLAPRDLVCIGDNIILAGIAGTAARHHRRTLWLGAPAGAFPPHRVHTIRRPWERGMIRQFRVGRARTCLIAFTDDMTAINVTVQLSSSFADSVIVLPASAESGDALHALRTGVGLRIVSAAQPVARMLHEEHPPFLVRGAAECGRLEILIVGRGAVAEAILADLLLCSLTTTLAQPSVTVLAPRVDELAAEYAMRMPELFRSVELRFAEAPAGGDGYMTIAALRERTDPVTNAYLCLDDDCRSLSAAGALDRLAAEKGWPLDTIFVHQRGGEAWRNDVRDAEPERLVPFGASNDLARGLGLIDAIEDGEARRLHDAYRAFADPAAPANVPWEALSEDLRDANRRQAAHLPAKLVSAGVDLHPWLAERRNGRVTPLPLLPDLAAAPELLLELSILEHERWMADRRLNGWRHGEVRDDRRRRHPDLVPFGSLSQRSKDYDAGMLRALSRSLASAPDMHDRGDLAQEKPTNKPMEPVEPTSPTQSHDGSTRQSINGQDLTHTG